MAGRTIKPSCGGKYPEGYYVYIHLRGGCGTPFYVGMGQGQRGWHSSSKTRYWNNIYDKHGASIEIAQDAMTREDAILLEMWLIAKFRHLGYRLANLSAGGESATGYVRTQEAKDKTARHHMVSVYCSDGNLYESLTCAADAMRLRGFPTASYTRISECAKGNAKKAYGRCWSFTEVPDPPNPIAWNARPVSDSFGMNFNSSKEACDWLRQNGYPKAADSCIVNCANGKTATAYGRTWRHTS